MMTDEPAPLRIVDQQAYDRIECNSCGSCCKGFSLNAIRGDGDPLILMELTANEKVNTYDAMWLGQLTPAWRDDLKRYLYSCSYLEEADDLQSGRCTIYESRPEVCRSYPDRRDGKANGVYEYCSWGQVEVFDFEVVR